MNDMHTDTRNTLDSVASLWENIVRQKESDLQGARTPQRRRAALEHYWDTKRELARKERHRYAQAAQAAEILRNFDEELGELLAAIRYVEHCLPRLSKEKRVRLSAKHDKLVREISELLKRKIVT